MLKELEIRLMTMLLHSRTQRKIKIDFSEISKRKELFLISHLINLDQLVSQRVFGRWS
jgi:hypothetical protein